MKRTGKENGFLSSGQKIYYNNRTRKLELNDRIIIFFTFWLRCPYIYIWAKLFAEITSVLIMIEGRTCRDKRTLLQTFTEAKCLHTTRKTSSLIR